MLELILSNWFNRNERFVLAFSFEYYDTIGECEESVVFAHTYVFTWVVYCTALANKDVASFSKLTAEDFYAKSFAF